MARGFWTGLLHGGVLSAATLAAFALLLPVSVPGDSEFRPQDPVAETDPPAHDQGADSAPADATQVRPGPADSAGTESPPEPARHESAATADAALPVTSGRPETPSIDLPVGSEFARGGDMPPQLPAPLDQPPDRFGQGDAPGVSVPPAEPAPVAVIADDVRPQTSDSGSQRAASEGPVPVQDSGVIRPEALGLPEPAGLPGLLGLAGTSEPDYRPDEMPAAWPQSDAEPDAPVTRAADLPASAADGVGESGDRPAVAPARRAPALDLSLPPDLTELRRAPRD